MYKRQVHNEVEYLLKAVDIGVDGYIMKDAESAELKKAINCIIPVSYTHLFSNRSNCYSGSVCFDTMDQRKADASAGYFF